MDGSTNDKKAEAIPPTWWIPTIMALPIKYRPAALLFVIMCVSYFSTESPGCMGLPGETAWIYAGAYDGVNRKFKTTPVFKISSSNRAPESVELGDWIELMQPRRTMILDYGTRGLDRALDSPFTLDGKIVYTCKTLGVSERLYVSDRKINGPSPSDSHVWLRVRRAPPG
jgi:hypothetical protein